MELCFDKDSEIRHWLSETSLGERGMVDWYDTDQGSCGSLVEISSFQSINGECIPFIDVTSVELVTCMHMGAYMRACIHGCMRACMGGYM